MIKNEKLVIKNNNLGYTRFLMEDIFLKPTNKKISPITILIPILKGFMLKQERKIAEKMVANAAIAAMVVKGLSFISNNALVLELKRNEQMTDEIPNSKKKYFSETYCLPKKNVMKLLGKNDTELKQSNAISIDN